MDFLAFGHRKIHSSLVPHRLRVATLVGTFFVITNHLAFAQTAESSRITVTGAVPSPTPWDDWKSKLDHIMSEVSGTQITVTKKASVIKLEKQPPVENNNLPELFTKAPGLIVSEQQNPGQFNFNYRGLGNPQESEFVTVLMDGVPLASDWIGFPTLYFLPLPQGISEIQLIRGGSSLLYGPEPAPAVNFVTKHPLEGMPWNAYFEQTGGAYAFYNTYGAVQEASGPVEVRLDGDYQHSDGQRDNGWYHLWQTNGYLGYRPDDSQLLALDFHVSRFDGGDPGRLTIQQFNANQNYSPTPYNENWVDRYSAILRYEKEFDNDWLMQAKGWYTHQEIDSRAAGNITPTMANPTGFPTSTTFGYEEFNNGGVDIRFRKKWGDDTMFKGSALTFGGVAYHGDAPFTRYTLNMTDFGPNFLYAPRGTTAGDPFNPLDQARTSDYQAIFAEGLIRIGKFHIVPSFRLDHENVEVDSTRAPYLGPNSIGPEQDISADHWVPLWGIGVGNDFGDHNETYFSASTGWRPTRYFDIAGTTRTVDPVLGHISDPFESLDLELGVHGTPFRGFWYDVGLFWMEFSNRTESQNTSTIDFVIVNTGNTRHRGFEGEISYDFLARFQNPRITVPDSSKDDKATVDKNPRVAGASGEVVHPLQLVLFSNIQFLDAEFTESTQLIPNSGGKTFVGKTPAYAPDITWKGGISFKREHGFNFTVSAIYVSDEFWQDSNQPLVSGGIVTVPAIIPAYYIVNFSAEYYITKNVRLIAGITNLTDEKYYSRAFLTGLIEPAPRISGWGGISIEF